MIYFDNAATTGKKPETVINAVATALKSFSANPGRGGYKYSTACAEEVYRVREEIADFFNADGAENVVFTLNCTHSINIVLKGVLKRGDHIVVSSLEHNAVMRPLKKIGVPYTIAEVSLTDDNKTVESFRKALKPNTKMIFCMGASNVLGKCLPLEKIGKLCREKRILFAVDAAQTAGVTNIDIKKIGIDYLCIAPHKGLYAPMGIGILICRKGIYQTVIEGGTGTNSLDFNQPFELPERLESGTINVPAIMGVGAGVDFVKRKGIERIYNHEIELLGVIYNSLSKNNDIELYTPYPKAGDFMPVMVFNFKGVNSAQAAEILDKNGIAVRGGYHCAPTVHSAINTLETGALRVSLSAFNTKEEVKNFLQTVNGRNFYKNVKKSIE